MATNKIELVTVDSGACDAIVPPGVFPNTAVARHNECGATYRACGEETVTNLGLLKCVEYMFPSGLRKKFDFQVGDKITKSLLAVSKLAQSGAGVWFGPAPEYESYVTWDKGAFVASSGLKTHLILKNGT